jgi:hypothetical protein
MDVDVIREKLKDYVEVEDVFDLKRNCYVKYITLKDDEEQFFEGGKYVKMGNNTIMLLKGIIRRNVPIVYKRKDGRIYYRTRFFMKETLEMNRKNFDELLEIVESQQQVINKLLRKNKKYEKMLGIE